MAKTLTIRQFFKRFPNEAACLKHIMEVRFGLIHDCRACGVVGAHFHKITGRRAYVCGQCGDHLYPCAGTIFEDSRTPLQLWFYALYLFVATRHGVSGKELQRQLGVTYKTAWRMGQQIRKLMAKADPIRTLQGHIELDETYVGGRRRGGKRGRGAPGKTIVMGLKERQGRVEAVVIPDVKMKTLHGVVAERLKPGSIVSTDELRSYNLLARSGFRHGTVQHGKEEYARYDQATGITHHVNSVESFWSLFKRSVASTHIQISRKYMHRYLGEFTFRQNHRAMENGMFDLLLASV
jgi:transposase-like protein